MAQLRWRCRRGMRELDVLFTRWLEQNYPSASPEQQRAFEQLLDCEDDVLWAWVTGRLEPDRRELQQLIRRFRNDESND
ncbi:MAG: succinate dehydrogenase assembly factor 2 [Pseudomonadota bacterium]